MNACIDTGLQMFLCIYVCLYVCMFVCTYLCMQHVSECMYAIMCESICAWQYVWMYAYVQICMYICTPVRLHVYLYTYVDTCKYIQGCQHALLVRAVLAPLYFPTYIVYLVGISITLYFHPLWYLLFNAFSDSTSFSLSRCAPSTFPTHSLTRIDSLIDYLTDYLSNSPSDWPTSCIPHTLNL